MLQPCCQLCLVTLLTRARGVVWCATQDVLVGHAVAVFENRSQSHIARVAAVWVAKGRPQFRAHWFYRPGMYVCVSMGLVLWLSLV